MQQVKENGFVLSLEKDVCRSYWSYENFNSRHNHLQVDCFYINVYCILFLFSLKTFGKMLVLLLGKI